MNPRIVLFFALGCFFSCSKQRDDVISGHWVSSGYFEGKSHHTLDIADSTMRIDDHGTLGLAAYLYRVPKQDYFDVFLWSEYGPSSIKFRNDTLLFINPPFEDSTFVRIDSVITYQEDIFCDLSIVVNPPEDDGNELISFPRRSLMTSLSFGNLKGGYQSDSSQIKPDSFLIQVDDVFLDFSELPDYIKMSKSFLDEYERDKMVLCVNADKKVPQFLLDKLIQTVKDYDSNLKIYRGYINWKNRKVLYKKLN